MPADPRAIVPLIREADPDTLSPYLAQHVDNPVAWWEWGDDAFAEARDRDVPVFLSVGYSSCHWCHVMAHESFEDDAVAAVMNRDFVNVKVDREERPDVDAVYMSATTALTGRGGWPMSVFLDHERRPFYAGTYWPRQPRHGMPDFPRVLAAVTESWQGRRDEVLASAEKIGAAVDRAHTAAGPDTPVDLDATDRAAALLVERAWDRQQGGFGRAPKFPQSMTLQWLLDRHVLGVDDAAGAAVVHTLDAMQRGGIHDHVGGGFARYATDAAWLVPHFEKMLYDNGLLLGVYADAAVVFDEPSFARTARRLADYLLREMQHPDGGFHAATDADSEGREGAFFVWDLDELRRVLDDAGADTDLLVDRFGVTAAGNWEGTNILALAAPLPTEDVAAVDAGLEALRVAREEREHPGLDDKVLVSWNALAIRGLVRAGVRLDEPRWVAAAERAAGFLDDALVVDGRLRHSWRGGAASVPALLEDVAGLAAALLDLHAATAEPRWFDRALELAEDAVVRFAGDDDRGAFHQTPADLATHVTRPVETWDNATPSGNSLLAQVAWRLGALTGEPRWTDLARRIVDALLGDVERGPTGHGELLQVAEALRVPPTEVAVVGADPDRSALLRVVHERPRPATVVAAADDAREHPALLRDRPAPASGAAAHVCHGFVCDLPVTDPDALRDRLTEDRR